MARRMAKALGWIAGGLLLLGLLAAGVVYVVVQTQTGHDFVLRTALAQAPRHLDGELAVGAIRSDGLLRGFTLHDVRLTDDRGRPVLEADSLRVRYAYREFLRGEVALVPAEIWRPRVVVETLHGDERSNLERVFRVGPPDPDQEPGPPAQVSVLLRRVGIYGGELTVRLPLDEEAPPGRGVAERVPGFEGLHRRFDFTGIEARVREADLLRPDVEGERLVFDLLSLEGRVLDDPFRLEELRGVVTRVGSTLEIDAERLRLPSSAITGAIGLDWSGDNDEGLRLDVRVRAEELDLADLRWIEPRLPDAQGSLELEVSGPAAASRWRITSADLRTPASRLRGDLGLDLGPELRLAETDLEMLPLELAELEPWLEEPLPVAGRLRGRVRASGPLGALRLDGQLTYDDPAGGIPASSARFGGVLEGGDLVAVRDLSVEVDPLRYETLRAFAPELDLRGEGRADVVVSGRLPSDLDLSGTLSHRAPGQEGFASQLAVAGSLRATDAGLHLDLEGDLAPLSLDGLALALGEELPVRGEIRGRARAVGVVEALSLDVDLETEAGRIAAVGRLNALDPGAGYRAEGGVTDFALHRLAPELPDPVLVSGDFQVEGRGLRLEDLEGSGRLALAPVRVASAELDRVTAVLRAQEGRLRVDTLEVRSPYGSVDGSGDLALREEAPDGIMQIRFESESLARLRPLLARAESASGNALTSLEREILRFDGVDPDTLPGDPADRLDGRVHGELHLRGSVLDLAGDGFLELAEAVWGELSLDDGRVEATGRWSGSDEWEARGTAELEGIEAGGFSFEHATGGLSYRPGAGEATLLLRRAANETYEAAGAFRLDGEGVEVRLDELVLELPDIAWRLEEPARLRVEERTLTVDDLSLVRPPELGAEEPARMTARGTLSLDGRSAFRTEMRGVEIGRLAAMLQVEDPPEGTLDLTLDVEGPADAPEMRGGFLLRELTLAGARLSQVEGTLDYRDLIARAELAAELDGRRLLTGEGRVPVDLSFRPVEDRFPDRSVDLTLTVDSLPAASALAFLDVLENIEGTLEGRIHLRGTPRELRPSGEILVRNGAVSLPEEGIRITQIDGAFRLDEDRTIRISADGRARGAAWISGTVSLEDPMDPGFDLTIEASGFQAVERRDLAARIGGRISLTGSYTRPHVGGRLRVEQGSLFLEELARTAEVVDLTDPAFFDVVDTTLVAARPVVAPAENPFLQNLRVDVELGIQRDFWLRSREMDVEMSGDLIVTFDRPRRELLLVGGLQAVRGSYMAFGRQFQVRQGTVEFVGTPGINPALQIEAVNRVRREGGEPLNVVATLGGTLEDMRVDLSSDAQPPIAESDLISYLIFGRPSYALASGEVSVLEGAAGAGVGVGIGAIATQLGSVVARQIGVDYFTITQAREIAGIPTAAGLTGTLAGTQIEMGQYVGQNLFLALSLRPLTGLGARTQTQFPGARLEWRFTDMWTAEAFLEDRFAREASFGFGELGIRLDKVMGLSLYREWGY